ncbi:MAG: hypothetical protein IJA60_07915 [Clostridia bacterium]|nr:hypothetical protein [Clostridia bacterium]
MRIKDNNIYADDGMMLTDGKVLAKAVFLGDGADASVWHEVSEKEAVQTERSDEF